VASFNGTTLLGNVTTSVGNQYSLTWNNAGGWQLYPERVGHGQFRRNQ